MSIGKHAILAASHSKKFSSQIPGQRKHTPHATNSAPAKTNSSQSSSAQTDQLRGQIYKQEFMENSDAKLQLSHYPCLAYHTSSLASTSNRTSSQFLLPLCSYANCTKNSSPTLTIFRVVDQFNFIIQAILLKATQYGCT